MSDYLENINRHHLTHAEYCMKHRNPEVRSAYLTGVTIGMFQGFSLYEKKLDQYGNYHAQQFKESLGETPGPIPFDSDLPAPGEQAA